MDLKTYLNGIFDSLYSIAKAPLNLIIRAVNTLISGMNKISFTAPSWAGGGTIGVNIPKIPLLAKGTVVKKPTQAVVGESGAEAVMPLENNLEYLDYIADRIADKIGIKNGGYYIIQLDGRTIQKGMAKRKTELQFSGNGEL